jgi:4-amino-4-deoxy-L-arabinose transferase
MMGGGGAIGRPRLTLAILALAFVYYVWPLTLATPLLDPDEGLHAAIAREMADSGDWVTPRFLGQPFFDKPALFFWAEAASIRLFGRTEAAVRAPGLAFGLLGAITTGLLGAALLGRRTGLVAGLLYATMLLPASLNQSPVHDVALVPWTNLALLCFWRARGRTRGAAAAYALGAGVALGLAALTKGLVGPALVLLAFGAFVLWSWRGLAGRGDTPTARAAAIAIVALAVAAAVAAPWFVEMSRLHPGYARYYFLERHVGGFATTTQLHSDRPWWYYLPILAGGALPWVAAIGWTRRPGRRDGLVFAWIWLATNLIFLSVARAKLLTYVLPVFPAVAILAAAPWAALMEPASAAAPPGRRPALPTAILASLMLPACLVAVVNQFELAHSGLIWAGGLTMSAAWGLTVWPRRRPPAATRELAVGLGVMALTFVFVMRVLLPPVAATLTARDLAEHYNRLGALPDQLLFVDERLGSFVFYLDPALRAGLTAGDVGDVDADELRARPPGDDTVIAVPEEEYEGLARELQLAGLPWIRAGHYRLYDAEHLRF